MLCSLKKLKPLRFINRLAAEQSKSMAKHRLGISIFMCFYYIFFLYKCGEYYYNLIDLF